MKKRYRKTHKQYEEIKHLSANQYGELFNEMINSTQYRGEYVITEMVNIKKDLWKIVYTKVKEDTNED